MLSSHTVGFQRPDNSNLANLTPGLACGPPASFSVHLASSAVTPVGSVHKSRGDNVVRMWVQLKS